MTSSRGGSSTLAISGGDSDSGDRCAGCCPFAISPDGGWWRPLSVLLMPAWRLAGFPLAPVTRWGMVVPRWYEQDRARNELGSDDDPRAVVSRTHIPAAVREGPILPVVEEEIGGICRHGRRGRHVLDLRRLGDDDQRWRSGKLNADVHVHLSVDWGSQGDSQ